MTDATSNTASSPAPTPRPIPAYILAGGHSSRFGSDKARARIDGQPLIGRIAAMLAPLGAQVTVVADVADKYADLGLPTIADIHPDLGPMGGLHTALAHLSPQYDWLLLTSCDLVTIQPAWFQLLAEGRSMGGQNVVAVAFKPDRWQPLVALYHRSIAVQVARRIACGDRAMQRLLDAVDAVAAPLPTDWPAVLQVNTVADLARIRSDNRP